MSLKAFHLLFIIAANALALGCAVWALKDYRAGGQLGDLLFGLGWLATAAGLIAYERYFLRKFKKVSFL